MSNFTNSNQIFTLFESGLDFGLVNWITSHITNPFVAYCIPVLIVFTILNNVLVIVIFITSKDVSKHIKPSIRVYYIATSIGDVIVCIPFHLTFFLGTMHYSQTH